VNALDYCHTRKAGKVLHRDLKPQNILLSGKYKVLEKQFFSKIMYSNFSIISFLQKLKLADFGLAKVLRRFNFIYQIFFRICVLYVLFLKNHYNKWLKHTSELRITCRL
jgi:serine/threonine protein kinase